ncbi:uncharacterized protein LOC130746984 [Lotus japonicus]|uniref:uncharacterized protein LOC130746984 n=1 Tax=Lotus japonicus TaxID=34305 RepID=UPI0025875AD9|nr:uncharacterized protein LOC130746984 [Lotus japonicus]
MKLYEGDSNPTEHINFFVGAMKYAGASDPIYCRCFPMSLGKGPMNWFQNLPNNSIHNWEGVMSSFLSQYSSVRNIPKSEETLALIKQGEKESLKAFLNRFNKEAGDIPDLLPQVRLIFVRQALRPGPFLTSLDGKKARTLEEFQTRSEKYINMEEAATLRSTNQNPVHRPFEKARDRVETKRREPRRRSQDDKKQKRKKFDSYIPLNSSISRIFPGHNTDECLNLKDKVEKLVRIGRLSKYVALSSGNLPRPRSPPPRRSPTPSRVRARTPPRNRARTPPRARSPQQRRSPDRRRSPDHRRSPDRRRSLDRQGQDEVQRRYGTNLVSVGSITGGWAAGGPSNNSRKRSTRIIMSAAGRPHPSSLRPPQQKVSITFTEDDYGADTGEEDDPIVVEALIANGKVRRVLIDTGSSVDIMFYDAYKTLGLSVKDLIPYDHDLIGFIGTEFCP